MTENIRILLVEEEPTSSLLLTGLIRMQTGYSPDTAVSGQEALYKTKENRYDLILLDYWLPDGTGARLAGKLRRQCYSGSMPVLAGLVAAEGSVEEKEFLTASVQQIITRPVRPEALQHCLRCIVHPDSSIRESLRAFVSQGDAYHHILQVSLQNIREICRKLESLPTAGWQADYRLHFHSLKGICLNLGLEDLSEASRQMEEDSKEEQYELLKERYMSYIVRMQELQREMEQILWQQDAGEKKGMKRPAQPVWELSLRLRDSLADYAYLTACECLELLKQQETQQQTVEALAQIEQALQAFEYEQAQELLSALYPEETE